MRFRQTHWERGDSIALSSRICSSARLAFLLLLLCAGLARLSLAGSEDPTRRTIKGFHAHRISLLDALLQLGQQQKIPLGIEYIDSKAVTDPISLDTRPATIAQVLDAILAQQPGYAWSVQDGVIVITHKDVPNGGRNLLNIVLPDFAIPRLHRVDAGLSLQMALDKELHPEVQGWAGDYPGEIPAVEIGPFSMHDVTVREALNRIVSEAGGAAWVVQVPPGNLDKLPSYGLWRIIEYENPPKLYGPFFQGILRYVTTHGTPRNEK
jgi:hypothetical protein